MNNINTIILSSGEFKYKNYPLGMMSGEGLFPTGGRPSIFWCLDAVKKNKKIIITIKENNKRLENILKYKYDNILIIKIQNNKNNILFSLASALNLCDTSKPTQIILGDTAIRESLPEVQDVFLTSDAITTSKPWCLVDLDIDRKIINFYDKEKDLDIRDKEILIGYYSFSNTERLIKSVSIALAENKKELSDAFKKYITYHPVKCQKTLKWLDFGHAHGIANARLSLLNSREFNNITVQSTLGILTKSSYKKQKLYDEYNWYTNLPKELKCLAPRIIDISEDKKNAYLSMELYGYSNLAELYLYGQNDLNEWQNIITLLFKLQNHFYKYQIQEKNASKFLYETKTENRIKKIYIGCGISQKLINYETIYINGKKYKNLPLLHKDIFKEIKKLHSSQNSILMHGDYCLSNILYDPLHGIFKLIDPRGRCDTQSIYGDHRYDIAKLRHSVIGFYDFIIAGMYKLNNYKNEYEFTILSPEFKHEIKYFFNKKLLEYNYDINEIKFIESLLFLTMIPLHKDSPKRQTAFYLTAISKLNKALYE